MHRRQESQLQHRPLPMLRKQASRMHNLLACKRLDVRLAYYYQGYS